MLKLQSLFLILLILLTAALPARERIALVIGNANYHVMPLDSALNDARDVAKVLRQSGFRVTVKLDADQQTMETAIGKFAQSLHANTEALFYYAGHGAQAKDIERENYLIPISAIPKIQRSAQLRYKAVPASLVLREMKDAGSPLNIIILDACRNSPFRGFSRSLRRGLARMPSVDGSLIAYSTAPGTVAIDSTGGRNSPYTAQLLKFMRQPGLTLEQVLKNTRREVKRATNGDQTPWYESSLDGYFYFSQAPVIPPLPVTARLTVRSNEYNDEVRINGKSYGSTPVEADLPLGRYHLRVTKDGFQVYESWPELRGDMKIVARLQREPIAGNSGISGAQGKRILRYIAYNNGTALDTETGLMWMRCVLGQTWDGRTCRGKGKTMDWATAKRQRLGFAGYDDWRLPTIEELRTLVYCSNGKPAYFSLGKDTGFDRKNTNFINFLDAGCTGKPNKDHKSPTVVQEVFPVHPRWILSASNANYSDYVLIMNFSNGSDNNGRNDSRLLFHVRLVRGGQ